MSSPGRVDFQPEDFKRCQADYDSIVGLAEYYGGYSPLAGGE
ncbi:MAG: hypothetical protein QXT37_09250 [Thermofilaceae archaeon]